MKTDAQLQQDVIAELKWNPLVTDTQIGVSVVDRVVTLNGHVDNYAQKIEAEKSALRVAGVKALAIEIDVKLPNLSERTDADIARTIENVLAWSSFIYSNEHVKVMVENGWVTLSGEVEWAYQRSAALHSVQYLFGVKGVSNQIVLKPQVSSSRIKFEIEAAINRQARVDADSVQVQADGGEVTLSGLVHSHFERNYMTNLAWRAPGVMKVINHIEVVY